MDTSDKINLETLSPSDKVVISIGRQFGSGGRVIGQALAQQLQYDFYDANLLNLAAREIGFDPSFFAKTDEKPAHSTFFQNMGQLFWGGLAQGDDNYMSDAKMFSVQSQVIRKVAAQGPCVIMGRCSDYVLRQYPNLLSIYFYDTMENRIQRVSQRMQNADLAQVRKLIVHTDACRAKYYNYYTDKEWGYSSSYNLCVDVSVLGLEGTIPFVMDFLQKRFGNQLFNK